MKIITWYKAVFLDYPYWRLIYPDGRRTKLLYYGEAKSLKDCFKGKLIIDYSN